MEPLSNPDTNGAEESVIVSVSEVSSFQRLKCMQYLGWEKVSCLERCPQFIDIIICIYYVQRTSQHTHSHTTHSLYDLLLSSELSERAQPKSLHSQPHLLSLLQHKQTFSSDVEFSSRQNGRSRDQPHHF